LSCKTSKIWTLMSLVKKHSFCVGYSYFKHQPVPFNVLVVIVACHTSNVLKTNWMTISDVFFHFRRNWIRTSSFRSMVGPVKYISILQSQQLPKHRRRCKLIFDFKPKKVLQMFVFVRFIQIFKKGPLLLILYNFR
jgi:hypothetical protein